MPYIVGLTGGIGSGKSTAAQIFEELGATVIDTDAIAHTLTAPGGAAIEAIGTRFGVEFIAAGGALDRGRMRELVFVDAEKRHLLESILHPLIRERSNELILAAPGPYVILAVPLLIESGNYAKRCRRILVVDCPEKLQIERVMARSGMEAAQVRAIMTTQVTREARLAAADDVIDNSRDPAHLRREVEALHQRYLQLAAAGG